MNWKNFFSRQRIRVRIENIIVELERRVDVRLVGPAGLFFMEKWMVVVDVQDTTDEELNKIVWPESVSYAKDVSWFIYNLTGMLPTEMFNHRVTISKKNRTCRINWGARVLVPEKGLSCNLPVGLQRTDIPGYFEMSLISGSKYANPHYTDSD